jgi:cytochrome c5
MLITRSTGPCFLALAGCVAIVIAASSAAAQGSDSADKGGEVLTAKCSQCHTDSMWREQRQDRRAWEATLYRMVGRGAAWELEEINAMADYLGRDFSLQAAQANATTKK